MGKVKKVAEILDVPFIIFAKKPLKYGFKKAQKLLWLKSEEIAVVRRPGTNRYSSEATEAECLQY
ncbi:MAG: hypothetical protein FWC53_02370 [Firmicutes bacterium]|nr:hypothetical protein [Bacillota bacterium]